MADPFIDLADPVEAYYHDAAMVFPELALCPRCGGDGLLDTYDWSGASTIPTRIPRGRSCPLCGGVGIATECAPHAWRGFSTNTGWHVRVCERCARREEEDSSG